MASDVDICNLALSRLGDEANIASLTPPEGSSQADHCARWYPVSRDKALSAFPWTFAVRTARLARLAIEPIGFKYAFAAPADDIRLLDIFDEDRPDEVIPYRVERGETSRVLLCDSDRVCARYISQQNNPAFYSPSFVDALAWLLASDLAGPMHTGATGIALAGKCYEAYRVALDRAKAEDGTQQMIDFKAKPSMMGDYHG